MGLVSIYEHLQCWLVPRDSTTAASKENILFIHNTFWLRSPKRKKKSSLEAETHCASLGESAAQMSSKSDKTTLWRLFFSFFPLHLPTGSAKMSREKFMSVIIWEQKPLFCHDGKPVKFQSLVSKVFASLWLSTAGTPLRVGLPGNWEADRRSQEHCDSLVFT